MGLFRTRRASQDAQELAAERRRRFLETFGDVSADGHGQKIEESTVLDNDSRFDLHNAPAKPAVVDDKDFTKPAPLWTEAEEAERRVVPTSQRELSEEEQKRREKFNAFFDTIPADKVTGPIPDRSSLEQCRFEDMPVQPPADPQVDMEEKKQDNLVWYDYSEVKLTPKPEKFDPVHQRKVETFNALYNNVSCNVHYSAVH